MFKDKKEKYTYLVPSDQAWRNLHKSFATVHKILFMGDFAYQVPILGTQKLPKVAEIATSFRC